MSEQDKRRKFKEKYASWKNANQIEKTKKEVQNQEQVEKDLSSALNLVDDMILGWTKTSGEKTQETKEDKNKKYIEEKEKKKEEELRLRAIREEEKKKEEELRLRAIREEEKKKEEELRLGAIREEEKKKEEELRLGAIREEEKKKEEELRLGAIREEEKKKEEELRLRAIREEEKKKEEELKLRAIREEEKKKEEELKLRAIREEEKKKEEELKLKAIKEKEEKDLARKLALEAKRRALLAETENDVLDDSTVLGRRREKTSKNIRYEDIKKPELTSKPIDIDSIIDDGTRLIPQKKKKKTWAEKRHEKAEIKRILALKDSMEKEREKLIKEGNYRDDYKDLVFGPDTSYDDGNSKTLQTDKSVFRKNSKGNQSSSLSSYLMGDLPENFDYDNIENPNEEILDTEDEIVNVILKDKEFLKKSKPQLNEEWNPDTSIFAHHDIIENKSSEKVRYRPHFLVSTIILAMIIFSIYRIMTTFEMAGNTATGTNVDNFKFLYLFIYARPAIYGFLAYSYVLCFLLSRKGVFMAFVVSSIDLGLVIIFPEYGGGEQMINYAPFAAFVLMLILMQIGIRKTSTWNSLR